VKSEVTVLSKVMWRDSRNKASQEERPDSEAKLHYNRQTGLTKEVVAKVSWSRAMPVQN
jgi:hypothetical protein